MSSKFEPYRQIVIDLSRQHPELGSDSIAGLIAKVKPSSGMEEINVASLGRWIRSQHLLNQEKASRSPKILLFDIETAPIEAYVWGIWDQNIGLNQIKRDWCVLCWSGKWLFDDNMMSYKLTRQETLDRNDHRIIEKLWKVMDEADIIIAHGLNRFDKRKANSRFLKYRMGPPSHYETIDTLQHFRKHFGNTSNKLEYAAQILGVPGKLPTSFELWRDVVEGDTGRMKQMSEYCDQDVRLLEDVYLELRPFIKPHPNVGLYVSSDVGVCPTCGSDALNWGGEYRTYANVYDAFRCGGCGATGRARRSSTPKSVKDRLVIATP